MILCVRLTLQVDVSATVLAAGYSAGFAIFWPMVGVHWLPSLVCALVAFGPTYVYLRGLDGLEGWRFWAFLPLGILVCILPEFVAEAVGWVVGVRP